MEGGDISMSSIDERVVALKFKAEGFQDTAQKALGVLDRLKSALHLPGASKGLEDVTAAAKNVNLGTIAQGVENISQKFGALSVIGITALSKIASKAIDVGTSLVKSLTIDPISDGFSDYNAKLTSVKTIMNATGASLQTVNGYFTQLDTYADKTVYNLTDMTGAFAKFTNAGVGMDKSVPAIKGIANMVALAGQGADAASIAMYNLSQSISGGFLTTTDYKSLNLANVATSEWKQQMIDGAVAAGKLKKSASGAYTIAGSTSKKAYDSSSLFNEALSEGWASADVLLKVLGDYGDETTAIGKKALGAAQDVKSLPMMMDTLKASVGTGWTDTFESLLGNVDESTQLFTGLTNTIQGVLDSSSKARNGMLKDWKALGGRTVLIDGFKMAYQALGAVVTPIKKAFQEVFPQTTGKQLLDLSVKFREFTRGLTNVRKSAGPIQAIFKAVFTLFKIGLSIVAGFVRLWTSLFSVFATGAGTSTSLLGIIAELIQKFGDWVIKGQYVEKFFDRLIHVRTQILQPIVNAVVLLIDAFVALKNGGMDAFAAKLGTAFNGLRPILDAIINKYKAMATTGIKAFSYLQEVFGKFKNPFENLFGGKDGGDAAGTGKVAESLNKVKEALNGVLPPAEKAKAVWQESLATLKEFGKGMEPIVPQVKAFFASLKQRFTDFINNLTPNDALALLNTGFFIAFYSMFRKFISGTKELVASAKGVFDNAGGVLEQVEKNLKTMQQSVKADIILKIAGSLLVLAAACFILAKIDPKKLGVALGAIGILLGELIGALVILEKYTSAKGAIKMGLLSVAILALGISLLAMAAAVAIFGNMDPSTLQKGLLSIAVTLGIITGAALLLEKSGGEKALLRASISIGILSIGLLAFAGVLRIFAAIDTATLVNGGWKIAAVMVGIALAMQLMPKTMLANAAGLVLVSIAMAAMAGVLTLFALMDTGSIIKSLLVLAGTLGIMAAAMKVMEGTVKGSLALLIMVAALGLLVPIIAALGNLPVQVLVTAFIALAVGFGLLAAAGYLLGPMVPVLMGLAGAIALMGVAALAAGAGMLLFSIGLASVAVSGVAGAAALGAVIVTVAQSFPLLMQQVGLGLIAFAKVITEAGPVLLAALTVVFNALLLAIANVTPQFASTLLVLIVALLTVLVQAVPKMVNAGIAILLGILNGIKRNVGQIVALGIDIIVKFLNEITKGIPKLAKAARDLITAFIREIGLTLGPIAQSAADLIIRFINACTDAIDRNSNSIGAAGGRMGVALIKGMVSGIAGGIGAVTTAAKNMAQTAFDAAKDFLKINSPSKLFRDKIGSAIPEGTAVGIDQNTYMVTDSIDSMGNSAVDQMKKTISLISGAFDGDMNLNPTISPILDLSSVTDGARKMGNLLTYPPVEVGATLSVANGLSAADAEARSALSAVTSSGESKSLTFIQNNTSPKALSEVEIYRQTKNQLSVAKEAI